MHFLKPTLAKLALTALLVVLFVPCLQLSQPQCHEYAATSHGDGAPAPQCLDGFRTFLSYSLMAARITSEWQTYGGWDWKVFVAPSYSYLFVGIIISYLVAGAALHFGKTKISILTKH
jgi:hypothetical protein